MPYYGNPYLNQALQRTGSSYQLPSTSLSPYEQQLMGQTMAPSEQGEKGQALLGNIVNGVLAYYTGGASLAAQAGAKAAGGALDARNKGGGSIVNVAGSNNPYDPDARAARQAMDSDVQRQAIAMASGATNYAQADDEGEKKKQGLIGSLLGGILGGGG